MESSSLNTKEEILPYQFQPVKGGKDSSDDESWDTVDEDSEAE